MWRRDDGPVPAREAFNALTIDHLVPLVRLLGVESPKRKGDLVAAVTAAMLRPERVRALYEKLDPVGQAAVQEATHDPEGRLHPDRFRAKYSQSPSFHTSAPKDVELSYYERTRSRPSLLALFFPQFQFLPTDLRRLLLDFVPAPREFALSTLPGPPATVPQQHYEWRHNRNVEVHLDVPVYVRETAAEALHDLKAVLRLVEAGRLHVSDKKRHPTAAAMKAIADVLRGGDFYTAEDQDEDTHDPASDLAIKAFAWPVIAQAAGLAQKSGDHLTLAPAGRKALTADAPDAIRAAFKKWQGSTLLDEFSRVEAIKGQGKARLSTLAERRKIVFGALARCPVGAWFAVDDFFRLLRASPPELVVAHWPHQLYLVELRYGSFGYGGGSGWEEVQGRYVLALLFEYAAVLGLVDVAYIPPQLARRDFRGRWGADGYSCLSRYDGLLWVRLNALGAWCLGLAETYEPPARPAADVVQVLPNLDVVARHPPLEAADRLLLERFAEPQSEAVWRLTPRKVQDALEAGGTLDELTEFLTARSAEAMPANVQTFLEDQRRRAGQLRDLGTARLVECADAAVARELVADPLLRGKCQLAGERRLVFAAEDEGAIRKALRRLGYSLPPPG